MNNYKHSNSYQDPTDEYLRNSFVNQYTKDRHILNDDSTTSVRVKNIDSIADEDLAHLAIWVGNTDMIDNNDELLIGRGLSELDDNEDSDQVLSYLRYKGYLCTFHYWYGDELLEKGWAILE